MADRYSIPAHITMSSPDLGLQKRPRTAPTRFIGPPSSPPPTSPLPLPPISSSPMCSIHLATPQFPPPRTQVSLPDLRAGRSSTPERIHKTVHFAAIHGDPKLRSSSPFPSPPNTNSFTERNEVAPQPALTSAERSSPDDESRTRLRRSAGGRIWWSPSAVNRYSSFLSTIDAEASGSAPPLPPKSAKRRSMKPPQKAVARSPLHIPLQRAFEHRESDRTQREFSCTQQESLFHLDEPITSLPPLPCAVQVERRACYQAQASRFGEEGKASRLPLIPMSYRKSISRTSQATSENRISFCAVTNLEGLPDSKETESVAPLTANADTEDQPGTTVWYRRHRRYIWVVVTIFTVLIAAGGITAGVIWKLSRPSD